MRQMPHLGLQQNILWEICSCAGDLAINMCPQGKEQQGNQKISKRIKRMIVYDSMIVQAGKDSSDSNSQYISPLHDKA